MKTISYDIKNKKADLKKIISRSNIIVITASSFDGRRILTKQHLKNLKKK